MHWNGLKESFYNDKKSFESSVLVNFVKTYLLVSLSLTEIRNPD